MILTNEPSSMTARGRERVQTCLAAGCSGHMCPGAATLTQRRVKGGGMTVYLQCGSCGKAVSNALPLIDHPDHAAYPAWDDALVEAHDQKVRAAWTGSGRHE